MLEVAQGLAEETVKVVSAQLWPLSDADVITCLRVVHRWEQSLAVLKARLVQQVESRGIAGVQGHRSVPGWLVSRLRLDPHLARELVERADALRRRPTVEQAVLDGLLDMRQATVIAAAVNAIPTTLDAVSHDPITNGAPTGPAGTNDAVTNDAVTSGAGLENAAGASDAGTNDAGLENAAASEAGIRETGTSGAGTSGVGTSGAGTSGAGTGDGVGVADCARIADDAETALIGMAGQFSALPLRHLGARILAHVAPEIAERADEAALRRQETRAHAKRSFTLSRPVEGMVRVCGVLDVEAAAIVDAALQPLCVPTRDDRTPGQKRADAVVEVCRLALRTGELPEHGGEPPQVAVTIRFDTRTRQLATAVLDNGRRVSADTARRMACDARLIPIVLGSTGQVLDAGRSRRLASGPLRRALVARDHGCAFPGCDRPPRWCDAHHLRPWSAGGPTSLDNLVLLCRHHHRTLHEPRQGWRIRLGKDQLPQFIPPPWIDLLQRPQRNLYHPRI